MIVLWIPQIWCSFDPLNSEKCRVGATGENWPSQIDE